MFVRYFDLGAHKGGEVARMRRLLEREPLVSGWDIHAFEAHPRLARRCRWRFCWDRSVRVAQAALGLHEGTCALYLNRNLVGSSIYAGKCNVVPGRKIEVPCTRLSGYLRARLPVGWERGFNIIKSNIEGAEWEVWQDLVEHNLVGAFDLWLGSREGHDGWTEDFKKVAGMAEKAAALTAAFRSAGIYVYRFSSFDKRIPNSDIPTALHQALASTGKRP